MTIAMHPALLALAERWPTYVDDDGDTRCTDCDQMIYTVQYGSSAPLVHLLHGHGYRMDGRQYNNVNEVIGHAADAEGALPRQ